MPCNKVCISGGAGCLLLLHKLRRGGHHTLSTHTFSAKVLPSMLSRAMSMSAESLPSSLSLTQPPAALSTVLHPENSAAASRVSNSAFSSTVRVILSGIVCLLPAWLLLVLGWGQEELLCVARAATGSLKALLRLLLG